MAIVLVVDDRPINRELIVTLLEHRGHKALEAADGLEALELVRDHRPQLVISDILMPTMDGFEFVRRLRSDGELANTRVIFYTAHYHESQALELARRCGVSHVLTKPSEPTEILEAIDQALAGEPQAPAAQAATDFDREHLRVMTDKLSQNVRDLTEANQRLTALSHLNLQLASERDPQALLQSVCRDARDLIGAHFAVLCIRPGADARGAFVATSGLGYPADGSPAGQLAEPRVDTPRFAAVLAGRAILRFTNPGGDSADAGLPSGYPRVDSALVVPVASLHRIYGWLALMNKLGCEEFDTEDELVLAALAGQVGRIYENGSLYLEMKRRSEQLEESELRFRQLAENVREVFFLTNLDYSENLYVSPAYEEVWGRSRASLYADPRSWMDSVHPDDMARVATQQRDGSSEFERHYRILRPDGTLRWIRSRGFPIRDAAGKPYRIAGIAEDITEQVRLERELREREERLRHAQALAKLAHVVTGPDGSFESFSDTLPGLLGVEAAAVPPTTRAWLDFLHPDDRGVFRARAIAAGAAAKRVDIEYRLRRRDGSYAHMRQSVEPIPGTAGPDGRMRWFSTIQDVTEQRLTEEALRESERRFADMLANVELISLMLDLQGRITYCNEYLLRLSGWKKEEVIGRSWFNLFLPFEHGELRAVFEGLCRNEPSARHHESEIATRSGGRRTIRWNNSVLRSPGGEIIGTASIGEDITERNRIEAEIRRLNADLERRVAERTAELQAANEELEAFDYSISHDLRAPLTRIQGFASALLDDYGDRLDERGRMFLDRIRATGRSMDQLVTDFLGLSMVARKDLQRLDVDLSALALSVVSNLRVAHPERDVDIVIEPGIRVHADPGLTRIVVENLLGNAWKFTSRRTGAKIHVGSTERDARRVVFVRDNGAGFDPAMAGRLFEPFQRFHSPGDFPGTGVGLATVQRIVRRHGGRAWAEAELDRGAAFFFTLSP